MDAVIKEYYSLKAVDFVKESKKLSEVREKIMINIVISDDFKISMIEKTKVLSLPLEHKVTIQCQRLALNLKTKINSTKKYADPTCP